MDFARIKILGTSGILEMHGEYPVSTVVLFSVHKASQPNVPQYLDSVTFVNIVGNCIQ